MTLETRAILVKTFYLENYGEPDEPYWKRKGGDTYWIANLEAPSETFSDKTRLLNGLSGPISRVELRDSPMCIEMVDDIWSVTLEEAERRASINRVTCEDSDEYFDYVRMISGLRTWSVK